MTLTTRALLLLLLLAGPTSGAAADAPVPVPSRTDTSDLQAADVVVQLDQVWQLLREIGARVSADALETGLHPKLVTEDDAVARLEAATRDTLDGQPALTELQDLELQLTDSARRIGGWSSTLTARVQALQRDATSAHDLQDAWRNTARQLKTQEAPPALLARLRSTLAQITTIRALAEHRLNGVLELQSRAAQEGTRIDTLLLEVRQAHEHILGQLLVRDSPTLVGAWMAASRAGVGARVQASVRHDVSELVAYLQRRTVLIPTWLALLALTMLGTTGLRRWSRRWEATDATVREAGQLFERPFAVAVVVWFFLTPLAYGGAPGLVLHLTRLVLLVPVARIAGPMLGEALRPLLYGLVGFVLVDQMREILEVVPALERTVLAFQCAAGAAALLWLSRDLDRLAGKPGRRDLTRPVFDTARRVGLLLLLAALAANVLGYVRLARLLYLGTAHGAYAGVVLYTLAQVVEGLIVLSLGTWAAQALHVVQRHRRVILRRARRLVRVGMTVFWAGWVLRSFSILDDVLDGLGTALRAHLTIGQINLSLGDLVAFAITLWATFLISRLLRVVLEDEFFPRMHLGRGVPYAVASFSSYTVLLVGFFVALAAAGIGFDRLAVVAGALGVGVGFGLQSIVNNFVSGLILLFERPIQIGDVVQLGDVLGTVRRIGLRSSILHTSEGAEIIVPNANLIAQQVVNWTLSDRKRRIDLAVGVAYGTDPEQVLALLIRVARGQSDVLDEPEPSALFMGFGDSALNFELRAWTGNLEDCLKVRSGLAVAVNRALAEAGIEIPFPQRDLHVRSVDPVATALPLPGRKTGSGT